ncbi:hypothetical protein CWATWH0402_2443 [Crocosphaera watsonii WH 0402]|nr:hypothetical protein [Crocosphaera sp.]CCQ58630.1 hypothetical protein CWATWH0005_2083 [Crocosphaera watsonii WH 0005]CCQ66122.1 hypothetical protein CWATWH0402_2443 [Crocosphaera watsonii WH 0402]
MNHGQNNLNLKKSPVYKTEKPAAPLKEPKKDRITEKSRIITVKTTSLSEEDFSSWSSPKISHKEDSRKIISSSSSQKVSTPGPPVFFWEVLMTVALLIMALWMQGLPARQMPDNIDIDGEGLPSFEMTKPQMGF